MKPMFRHDGKVALVTGAARGIGAAIARTLANQGARVALADLDSDGATSVALQIQNGAEAFKIDLSNVEECRALVPTVAERFGRIDVLVNNAGICPPQPFGAATEADWDALMNVNARSQYFLMQAVCPIMKRQGGGRIINISSAAGRVGSLLNASIYSGTKAAILMMSKSVAREVAADGILVNCVAPGQIQTDILRNLPPDRLNTAREQIPLKRFGQPEEVAALVAFLASDECSFCTGATIDINGGWQMADAMIGGFHHTSFTVSNVDEAERFFVELFGLERRSGGRFEVEALGRIVGFPGAILKISYLTFPESHGRRPPHLLELIEYVQPTGQAADTATNRPGNAHLSFQVDDIHHEYERLSGLGVRFKSAPQPVTWEANQGAWSVYCNGPDGIALELTQPPPSN